LRFISREGMADIYWAGSTQTPPQYISRTKIEVIVKSLLSKLRERLRGEQGGKIFVEDVRDAIDIPTNKRGEEAI
jgi:nitrogen regulatory protein PII